MHTALKNRDIKTIGLNINEEVLDKIVIDPNLIQIRADSKEMNRRIQSFIEPKHQQVNTVNVQEFCCKRNDNENSCARVDAILIRRKDSKSHVRVHRVLNAWGPQTTDQSISHKAIMSNTNYINTNCSSVLDDKISATECVIGINKPVSKDIYERLKNIEDRILHLESISPEYKEFWATEDISNLKNISTCIQKKTYSMAKLNFKLYELEHKYAKKMKQEL